MSQFFDMGFALAWDTGGPVFDSRSHAKGSTEEEKRDFYRGYCSGQLDIREFQKEQQFEYEIKEKKNG